MNAAHRLPAAAAAALVLTQIGYPLTAGAARDRVTVAVVLLSAATAFAHAWCTRGLGVAAGFVLIVSGLGLAAEITGTAHGFPFGCYGYATGRLGPAVAGVPLVVALAWTGGLYPVWVVAGRLCSRARPHLTRAGTRVLLTAVGAVGWDLFLDPQMVADGQWSWCSAAPGLPGLPQIPYTNYLGWFAVATVMAILLGVLDREAARTAGGGWPLGMPPAGRPAGGPTGDGRASDQRPGDGVPIAVFLWTWLGSALAHAAFLGLPASACYGFLGLGVLGIPLLESMFRAPARAPDRSRRDRPPGRGPGTA
ncbi:carotenoid biosynthesis protein [Nocardia sp. BMG51109]|uniref:carotenoid biosynthesis protein n=1 Tax=Nocardia sp. BMG51109 TaxID=1056816 RepID=UPI0004667900|nr:carotenoid biosynthesis protein [Nocardia sp. BMG51109]